MHIRVVRGICHALKAAQLSTGHNISSSAILSTNSSWFRPVRGMASDKAMKFEMKGLCAPPVTAFKENGDLNLDIIPDYVKHVQEFGIPNVFVTGTTSEGSSLTVPERKLVAEAWIKAGKGKLSTILIHIGAGNLRESQELAAHAQAAGADAIACVGPSYHRPQSLEQYVYYMRDVAAAAPELPFYLYDIDFFSHIKWTAFDFFTLAEHQIPTLRGLKHTTMDFVSMSNLLKRYGNKYQILMGSDGCYLEGLAIGLHGTVCNTFSGGALNRMEAAFARGDINEARKEQSRAFNVDELRRKYKFSIPGGAKAILRAIGLQVGQPRCPLDPVSDETVAALRKDLDDIDFFQWGPQSK